MRVKKRINSTGRKRIPREKIEIRMLPGSGGEPLRASLAVDLTGQTFPADAAISLEAYRRAAGSMRFDCGTIGSPKIPPVITLDQIDTSGTIQFRLKVADKNLEPGKLLGAAERIQVLSDSEDKDQRSLFPVRPWTLGEQVWKVEIEPDARPVLLVNRDIPDIKQLLRDNPFVAGCVFPAAFRIVLEALALGDEDDGSSDDETTSWQDDWLEFCNVRLGHMGNPSGDRQEKMKWIDGAVDRFCKEFGFVTNIRKAGEDAE